MLKIGGFPLKLAEKNLGAKEGPGPKGPLVPLVIPVSLSTVPSALFQTASDEHLHFIGIESRNRQLMGVVSGIGVCRTQYESSSPTTGRRRFFGIFPLNEVLGFMGFPGCSSISIGNDKCKKYPERIPRSTERVRALHTITSQLHTAVTAANLTLYKSLLALAFLFQEPKTWLPVSFQTRQKVPQPNRGSAVSETELAKLSGQVDPGSQFVFVLPEVRVTFVSDKLNSSFTGFHVSYQARGMYSGFHVSYQARAMYSGYHISYQARGMYSGYHISYQARAMYSGYHISYQAWVCTVGTTSPTRLQVCRVGYTSPTRPQVCTVGTTSPTRPQACGVGSTYPTRPQVCRVGTTSPTRPGYVQWVPCFLPGQGYVQWVPCLLPGQGYVQWVPRSLAFLGYVQLRIHIQMTPR